MKHIKGKNSRSILTGVQEGDVQPNAVDLRLSKVFAIKTNVFELTNDTKKHRGSVEVLPDEEGFFNLEPGSYEVVMENEIGVGDNEAGWVITRSTLNRNGIFVTSGLYDDGYGFDVTSGNFTGGAMAGCMHINVGPARIKKGTRIAQYLSFDAESLHKYDGSYGYHKEHDQKYK